MNKFELYQSNIVYRNRTPENFIYIRFEDLFIIILEEIFPSLFLFIV